MKLTYILLCLLTLVSLASAGPVVCNFDSFSGSGAVPDGNCGITWGGQWTYYDASQPPYTPHSGAERIYPTGNALSGTFTFSAPVVFDGAWFSGYDTEQVSFTLFLNNVQVGPSNFLTPSSIPAFLSSGYSGLVNKVTVSEGPTNLFIMDDVTYESSAVPEPSSAVLSCLGFAGVLLIRRMAAR